MTIFQLRPLSYLCYLWTSCDSLPDMLKKLFKFWYIDYIAKTALKQLSDFVKVGMSRFLFILGK